MRSEEERKKHDEEVHARELLEEEFHLGHKKKKNPLTIIGALFLIFIILVMSVPLSNLRHFENPKNIPSLQEIQPMLPDVIENPTTRNLYDYVTPADPVVKQVSNKIVAESCSHSDTCYAKALYYFVRNNIQYISDPKIEYFETPAETLKTGGADCDGQAILLLNLLQSVGIYAEFQKMPGHIYVKAVIPEAPRIYKKNGWIYMDPTCKNCDFGKIPQGNMKYLENPAYN